MTGPLLELPMLPDAPEPSSTPGTDGRRFRVDGMDCAACAATVQKAVAALDGITDARVSFGSASLRVTGDAPDNAVTEAVNRVGYRARPAGAGLDAADGRPFWRRDARALSTSTSVLLLLVAVGASLAGAPRVVAEPLYLLSMAVGGWAIAHSAVGALARRSLDMNVLMTLAAVGAVGIGAYSEGAWVLVLFAVGTTLETFALERGRRSMQALMELAPAEARVLVDGEERTVTVGEVGIGALLVVRPGERIPLDGDVLRGASSVDEAPITGESVPVDKEPGDPVYAGALNVQGALTVRATRVAHDSTLSRVARLVEEAQESRAPSERFIDAFARIYTPLVFAAALLLATVPLLFGGDPSTWTYRALALLIVACPCSLVISVPVAVISAVGGAARRGILIKGGQALEDLGRVRAVAIDKTGTLTAGTPVLTTIEPCEGDLSDDEALRLMATVERHSEHPLAAAIVSAARERGLRPAEPERFEASAGQGVQATVDGRRLWAGGPRVIAECTGSVPDAVTALEQHGETVIALGEGRHALAWFGLADEPRPEAAGAVTALQVAGITRIVMLTGDAEPVARAVAEGTGIAEWRAGLLPEDKLSAVEALTHEVGAVAMVGDGVNDAPALAAAQVGVAMGAAGSDVALQSADVALMGDRLDRLAVAVGLSRRALRIMRFNVIASLVVKGAFVLLTPFGLVTLVVAVAADMGMSLLVTLNALRLLRRIDRDGRGG